MADLVRQSRFEIIGADSPIGRERLRRIQDDIGLCDTASDSLEDARATGRLASLTREGRKVFCRVCDCNQAQPVAARAGRADGLYVGRDQNEAYVSHVSPASERATNRAGHIAALFDIRLRCAE